MPELLAGDPPTVVLADAGPLIALARVNQLSLLQQLFHQIVITPGITQELQLDQRAEAADAQGLQAALAAGWLLTCSAEPPAMALLNPGVDPGEASVIRLACHTQRCGSSVLLLMDDRAGRAEARHQGLPLIGTAAVAVLSQDRGLIPSALALLQNLRDAGYFLSDAVLASVASHHANPRRPSA